MRQIASFDELMGALADVVYVRHLEPLFAVVRQLVHNALGQRRENGRRTPACGQQAEKDERSRQRSHGKLADGRRLTAPVTAL
jgi:hypothetical protein